MTVTYLMPCWQSPELLLIALPSLRKAINENDQIIVILNEYDETSIHLCRINRVEFICVHKNYGPAGVDLAIPLIHGDYVCNVNSDMLFVFGFGDVCINKIEQHYPCSVSPTLVEPAPNTPFVHCNLGPWGPNIQKQFEMHLNGRSSYGEVDRGCYNHPIFTRTDDFLAVGGYSNNFNKQWCEEVSGGRGLDDDFAFRLWKKFNYRFIMTKDTAVFHAGSLNACKLEHFGDSRKIFMEQNHMNVPEFHKHINYWKPIEEH